jgi:hypothetical protein
VTTVKGNVPLGQGDLATRGQWDRGKGGQVFLFSLSVSFHLCPRLIFILLLLLEEPAIEAGNFKQSSNAFSDIGGRGCKNILTLFLTFKGVISCGNRR